MSCPSTREVWPGRYMYIYNIYRHHCSLWSSLHLNPGIAVNIVFLQACVLWCVTELFLFTWRLDHIVLYFDRQTDYDLVCLLCDIEIALKISNWIRYNILEQTYLCRNICTGFIETLSLKSLKLLEFQCLQIINCYVCCSSEMSMHIPLLWTFDIDRRAF